MRRGIERGRRLIRDLVNRAGWRRVGCTLNQPGPGEAVNGLGCPVHFIIGERREHPWLELG